MVFKKYFTLTLLSVFLCVSSFAQTALEIVTKMDQKMKGSHSFSEMKIEIVRPRYTREMTMRAWSLGDDYSMTLVLSPSKDKGSTFLKRKKEIWNYVPSIDRQIKLPPSMMMQSWMGTDLTNDDLVKQSSLVTDYEHELLGKEEVEGRTCHKLTLTPKPESTVVWGKVIIWIDVEETMQMKTEFYDEEGELINLMLGKDVGEIGGRILPRTMEFIPVEKKGQKTIIKYLQLDFEVKKEESFFTTQNMKRLKP